MLDWLITPASDKLPLTWDILAFRLIVAAVYGGCVAAVFHLSYGRRKPDASIMITTLVLLAILVAMVSMVIGESVARAFSLVGALSIVRFRTVVEDTRDTVFDDGTSHPTPRYHRDKLLADDVVVGPALIVQHNSTTLVPPNYAATVLSHGDLRVALR